MKILDFILCGVPPSKKRAYGRNQRMSFRDSIVSTRVFTSINDAYLTVFFIEKSSPEIYKPAKGGSSFVMDEHCPVLITNNIVLMIFSYG